MLIVNNYTQMHQKTLLHMRIKLLRATINNHKDVEDARELEEKCEESEEAIDLDATAENIRDKWCIELQAEESEKQTEDDVLTEREKDLIVRNKIKKGNFFSYKSYGT